MFLTRSLFKALPRTFNTAVRSYQVCVLGGASDVGQLVSLMLRAEPSVTNLVVHDTAEATPGVVVELSHIPVRSSLKGYLGEEELAKALNESDLVLLVGETLQTPGVDAEHSFEANTEFVKTVATHLGKMPVMPFVGIATEPINTLVPMAAEIMRNMGTFDSRKMFGVTTIDWLRAQTLYGAYMGCPPEKCFVPVIGGHAGKTLVPLISKSTPETVMNDTELLKFVAKLQNFEDTITRAKGGKSPTVSVAYGILMFARQVLKALDGEPAQVNAFIENNDFGTSYFSGLVHIDSKGVKEMEKYTDDISQYECCLLEKALVELKTHVSKGKKVLEMDQQSNV